MWKREEDYENYQQKRVGKKYQGGIDEGRIKFNRTRGEDSESRILYEILSVGSPQNF